MDELYLKKLREMDAARQQGLAEIERQQNLFNVKPESPSIDNAAKAEALQKLQNPKFEQVLGQPGTGQTLTRRTYGPYQLETALDSSNERDNNSDQKRSNLLQGIKYLGGEHSEKDARKIAEEMQEIGKPVDYAKWSKILKGLSPQTRAEGEDEYITGSTRATQAAGGKSAKPLWYDDEEEK